jgi:hypothetical protein
MQSVKGRAGGVANEDAHGDDTRLGRAMEPLVVGQAEVVLVVLACQAVVLQVVPERLRDHARRLQERQRANAVAGLGRMLIANRDRPARLLALKSIDRLHNLERLFGR